MKKASDKREDKSSPAINSETENNSQTQTEKQQGSDESRPAYLARLVAVLTVICVVIAVLLASVNALTCNKIAENTVRAKTDSVLSIFADGDNCELYRAEEDGSEIYIVYKGENIIGYCAYVSSVGFGGNIDMMVGIGSDYSTLGVKIVSMSETPGVGSKTDSDDFLGQFHGNAHDNPTDGVDAVSGATISSNAIMNGVIKAHSLDVNLEQIAIEKQKVIFSPEGTEEPETDTTEKIAADTASLESEPKVTESMPATDSTTAETEAPQTEDIPLREQRRQKSYGYPVISTEADPTAQIEIPLAEETAPIETETSSETAE